MEKLKDKLSGIIYYGGIAIIMVLVGLGMRSCMPAGPAADAMMHPENYKYEIYYQCNEGSEGWCMDETDDIHFTGTFIVYTSKRGTLMTLAGSYYYKTVKK